MRESHNNLSFEKSSLLYTDDYDSTDKSSAAPEAQNETAHLIWGKASKYGSNEEWLPLWVHLKDTHFASKTVWDTTPQGLRNNLQSWLNLSEAETKILIGWLAASHDCGKASPDFSGRDSVRFSTQKLYTRMVQGGGFKYLENYGQNFSQRPDGRAVRHESFSALILEEHLQEITNNDIFKFPLDRKTLKISNQLTCILAGHHGRPETLVSEHRTKVLSGLTQEWTDAQKILMRYSLSLESEVPAIIEKLLSTGIPIQAQVILTALVIEADWIASTEDAFNLIPYSETPEIGDHKLFPLRWNKKRNIQKELSIPTLDTQAKTDVNWNQIFEQRFGFKPNYIQQEMIKLAAESTRPDIYILEAEMGAGKTEAAIIAAEILAAKHNKQGFAFALPTMATSDAIYTRIHSYLENLIKDTGQSVSLSLTHSKAQYSKARADAKSPQYEGWFTGKYRKHLNSHTVGTIDNVLMIALKAKYAYWRHLGMASKVIIIDEAHSADPYMKTYLAGAIKWLAAYQCPIIVLSATLTDEDNKMLVNSYTSGLIPPPGQGNVL